MIAQIDPCSGDLVWRSEEDTQKVQKEIKKNLGKDEKNQLKSFEDLNAQFCPRQSTLTLEQRYQIIQSFAEECQTDEELKKLLANKIHPIAYDGFEPSGRMHIAQGILRAVNVNKLVDAGVIFIFWVADWFAMLNNKMGGDLEKIRNVGRYFIEVWKAAGMKMHNVKFLWASDEINNNADEYWLRVLEISRQFTNERIMRCQQIMGRKEGETLQCAQMIYPIMQCSDIFFLKADITSLGLDQRKVNMLAREYATKAKLEKPIIISHKMLSGLKKGQEKMSKSDLDSAIFMEDSATDVERKINSAFCPMEEFEEVKQEDGKVVQQAQVNPIIEYIDIILESLGSFKVTLKKDGVDTVAEYKSVQEIKIDYYTKKILTPQILKKSVAAQLNQLIEPVRQHFQNDPYANQLLKTVRSYTVTK